MICNRCGTTNDDHASQCASCGADLARPLTDSVMQSYAPPQSAPAAATYTAYAGFWIRFLAVIIDTIATTVISFVIVLPIAFVIGFGMAASNSSGDVAMAGEVIGNILGLIIGWLYYTVLESSSWQATLGKRLLGLRVVDMEHKRIGFGRANARYWSKILSTLILLAGYIMAAFTQKKQGLHDMIASTLVVKES